MLFLTEMWERFSFYGLRALLIFYLIARFGFSDNQAFAVYGNYSALVYIFPLVGGMLADRYLGYPKAVTFGAVLMILGYAGLVLEESHLAHAAAAIHHNLPSPRSQLAPIGFYLSLALVIVGVGFLKSNISTMVGQLYERESPLRDSAFTIFTWGINIGATLASFTCGYVGVTFGWSYGFALAGAGMTLGLATFLAGQRFLPLDAQYGARASSPLTAARVPRLPRAVLAGLLLGGAIVLLVISQLLTLSNVLGYIVTGAVIWAVGRALFIGVKQLSKVERERLWCALLIWVIYTSFAALVEQMGSSVNLFNERGVDRHIQLPHALFPRGIIHHDLGSGFEIQSAQLLGVTAFLLLLLSPFFAWLWSYLEKRHADPATPTKLCLAIFSMAAGYGLIVLGTFLPNAAGQVNLIWTLLLYFFFAIASLIAGAIGLSAITRLAAARMVGFMVGLWMLGVALGTYVAAKVARLSSLSSQSLLTMRTPEIVAHYRVFFSYLALVSLLLGICFYLLSPLMRKWMHGLR